MVLQIDFEHKYIYIIDDITIQDLNMIVFKHKLGDFVIAGESMLDEEPGIDLLEDLPEEDLSPNTSVANYYNDKE